MKRIIITSSAVVSVGFDEVSKVLEIEMKEGDVIQYNEVPISIYVSFMISSAKDAFFFCKIKDKYESKIMNEQLKDY